MFGVNRYNKILNYFCIVNDVFSEEEVEKIIAFEDLQKFHKGAVGTGGKGDVNTNARDSEIMWLEANPNSAWLYEKFSNLVGHVNYDHFMYDIESFESFQYTLYRGNENQHYDWHCDYANQYLNFERKISASIMLTDPKEYEGGEFEIVINGKVSDPLSIKAKKGDVIFFASWMPHRVAPVKSGIRKSLVCWINGKRSS
jgi:PKHD-type hydroxylase